MGEEIVVSDTIKIEDIKRIIKAFHEDRCPHCNAKPLESLWREKIHYKCPGCLSSWHENQNYEVYFMEIEKVLKDGN